MYNSIQLIRVLYLSLICPVSVYLGIVFLVYTGNWDWEIKHGHPGVDQWFSLFWPHIVQDDIQSYRMYCYIIMILLL